MGDSLSYLHNLLDEMQYNDIFIIGLLMKIFMFLRNLLYFYEKEWNFYFKK